VICVTLWSNRRNCPSGRLNRPPTPRSARPGMAACAQAWRSKDLALRRTGASKNWRFEELALRRTGASKNWRFEELARVTAVCVGRRTTSDCKMPMRMIRNELKGCDACVEVD